MRLCGMSLLGLLGLLLSLPVFSQPASSFEGLEYRLIGPFRGGRSAAVTGVPGQPDLYYFGATGGGVWRTEDAGLSWENISDGYFGGSIGAVAVSEWDPNVIYVGGGEKTVRGNVSFGYGLWKSLDAGKTWAQMGLEKSRHIPRVRIHPRNPDLVYAAVMGDLFKSSEERGVYRSQDGGQTWEKALYVNPDAGAVDLILDPLNPRVIYASLWRIRRTPYSLESGGEGSGLWKSTDGGDTWTELTGQENGLPKGPLGIIGVTVSAAQRDRVWAIIEAKEGGVFRSDDGGESWRKTNDDRALRQRAWYYTRIYADPQDPDGVYVVNVSYHHSTDGGNTFSPHRAPHGDHHDLWIAPEDPERMIIGDDGGAQVSASGGETWTTYHNQPTAQFYRLTTDNHFPFRIYAAQQDNSTIRILHRTGDYAIEEQHWEATAGGESAHIAVDPENDDIVYGGSYGGFLTRVNHRTGEQRAINVWPDNPMGYGAEGMKYRFQWNFPIFTSPHDPDKLYAASNHLHLTTDEGQSWQLLSPDLTRNDSSKLGPSGGPITKDNTGVEYYGTIFAGLESPHEAGVLWTGSDDGLVHLSQDGGENWENVTPTSLPEWSMINSLEAHPTEPGGLYLAATRYKLGDYQPILFRTLDYGQTWTRIDEGIAPEHFTRVLRADPERAGLLYAGTESGMYVSFDDGASWQPLQLNLPVVPITDLTIKAGKLVVATQGRSLWILDDLGPLRQEADLVANRLHLFMPQDAYRMGGGNRPDRLKEGENHPAGAMVYSYLAEAPNDSTELKLVFLEENGEEIITFSNQNKEHAEYFEEWEAGINRFVWNLRYPEAKDFPGMILWWGQMDGPKAVPGTYQVRMVVGEDSVTQPFQVLKDPRIEASQADLQAQFDLLMGIRNKLTETHEALIGIREVREQLNGLKTRAGKDAPELKAEITTLDSLMTAVETQLYQTQNRSNQDPLNYPIKLNNKLAHLAALVGMGDAAPTAQDRAFFEEVTEAIDAQLARWQTLRQDSIPRLNQMVQAQRIDAIIPPADKAKP